VFYSRIHAEIFQDGLEWQHALTNINTRKWSNYSKTNPADLWNIRWKFRRYCPFLQVLWPNSWGQQRANRDISPMTSVKETWTYCYGRVKSLLMYVCLAVITYSVSWNLFAISLKVCRFNIFSHLLVSTDF